MPTADRYRHIAKSAIRDWLAEIEVHGLREERMEDALGPHGRVWIEAAASVVAEAMARDAPKGRG